MKLFSFGQLDARTRIVTAHRVVSIATVFALDAILFSKMAASEEASQNIDRFIGREYLLVFFAPSTTSKTRGNGSIQIAVLKTCDES